MEEKEARKTDLQIEGVNYIIQSAKKKNKKASPNKVFNAKLSSNMRKQEEEVSAMKLLYKEKFHVEDEVTKKYWIDLLFKGGRDARLEFSYTPEYPSDVPPTYKLTAPWVDDSKIKDISKELINIVSENFGQCIMYKWIDKIEEVLKKDIEDMKRNPPIFEEPPPVVRKEVKVEEKENSLPEVYEGKGIWDRGSCFTPYLAPVTSEKEVRGVIEKIEDCRKVSTAWRNTYAYRYVGEGGKVVEVGEDGGEPKAGGNLLKRLINYNANNVIVFISRRFGGSMLGPDRFKHLNDAADDVLVACGYKNIATNKSKAKNGSKTEKNKDNKKKFQKKKK
ncbi:Protein IMPACT [Armadillidium nasatum]|uniref:Protein IMPACT n=1 Tax=Armadillidium nasatum TaxID=96803 RepID=A0A5N5SJD6_9CRUS|nr:Protein IMPACT [Armadillidium nasatum]